MNLTTINDKSCISYNPNFQFEREDIITIYSSYQCCTNIGITKYTSYKYIIQNINYYFISNAQPVG